MQSLKVYRDYAAEQALALFYWLLCHDSVCVSAGALGVSQYIGEGWMPGWRLVTWISLSHSFLALFRPLVVNYFFFFSFFFFSCSMCLQEFWDHELLETFLCFIWSVVIKVSMADIPGVHLLCVRSPMLVFSFYLWLNFKRKVQTFVEVTQSQSSLPI